MSVRNETVENEVVEQSWTADCIRVGSVDEMVLAVRAFAEDIERMARENLVRALLWIAVQGRLELLRCVLCRNWMTN